VHYSGVALPVSVLRIQIDANHPVDAIDSLLETLADLRTVVELPRCRTARPGNDDQRRMK
jgi:hypothetical protein